MPAARKIIGNFARSSVKSKITKGKPPPRMSPEEKRMAREMAFDRKLSPTRIAEDLGRNISSITRLLAQKVAPKATGRPPALTDADVTKLCATLDKMVDEADVGYEVTLAMLMKKAKPKACSKVVADALHRRGYKFFDLRQKPVLTPEDVKQRFAFAERWRKKPKAFWLRAIDIHLDNHHVKCATTAKGRKMLSSRCVRGVYRTRGTGLKGSHCKSSKKLKQSTGAKGFLIAGGVGNGKVLVWHTLQGQWSGEAAADLYIKVVLPALKRAYPKKKTFHLLEDNDPTGNTSTEGKNAKLANKMKVFTIPKRSPDLNVLDYSIWSEVERRMRNQEQRWPETQRETREEFGVRLNRTAKNLSPKFVNAAI